MRMARKPELSNDQKSAFNNALNLGVSRQDTAMMRLALENGAEPNILLFAAIDFKPRWRDYFNDENAGDTGIGWAKLAVEFGADVNASRNDDKKQPRAAVHWLYDNFNPKFMDYVLGQGAGVDTVSPYNNTMLLRAVTDAKPDMIEYFLNKGANPMQVCGNDKDRDFPLHVLEKSDKFKAGKKAELIMLMMKHVPQGTENTPAPPQPEPPTEKRNFSL